MSDDLFGHPALHGNSLDSLFLLKECSSKRVSSYARDGSNHDWTDIGAGEDAVIADISGGGIVRHIWCTMASDDEHALRNVVIRAFWDGEEHPSVEAPIGDFFGLGEAYRKNVYSAPLIAAPQD